MPIEASIVEPPEPMQASFRLPINPQPDDSTCGPTCLQAVYAYYGDPVPLETVIREVTRLENGGTLAVMLGCHALRRGYKATIYTYNLQVFDLTWFRRPELDLAAKLKKQLSHKRTRRLGEATAAYLEFLRLGGVIRHRDLTGAFIRHFLKRGVPILTGLSATYLYRSAREIDIKDSTYYDDVRGEPSGHFVVLCGYDMARRTVVVADPLLSNPLAEGSQRYEVSVGHLANAIMLGILTYDANLLVIEPAAPGRTGEQGRAEPAKTARKGEKTQQ